MWYGIHSFIHDAYLALMGVSILFFFFFFILQSSLRHPNIVLLMGFSFAMPHPFMVTELLEGNLYKPLRDTKTTDTSFCQMVLDTLCGMRYLHSMHVVHFDLKPLNLLVDTKGTVKISDFGLSKFLRGKQESVSRDSEISTLLYMSPESIFEGSFDFKTDIFSFGMVLYEMMHVREHPDRDFCVDDTIAYDLIREPLMKKGCPLCPPWWPPEIVVSDRH
jgi:serine/threonine protein kinase